MMWLSPDQAFGLVALGWVGTRLLAMCWRIRKPTHRRAPTQYGRDAVPQRLEEGIL